MNEKQGSLTNEQKLRIAINTLLNPTIGGKKQGNETDPWSAIAEFVIEAVWTDMIKNPAAYMGSNNEFEPEKVRKAVRINIDGFKLLIAAFVDESDILMTELKKMSEQIKETKVA